MDAVLIAGRFRIGARLGAGGMGEVWAAQDERMRRPVAVKIVHALPSADEAETQARFEREVQLAGRVLHPNVVTVHDWGEVRLDERRVLYLVMELVPGVPLSRRLGQSTPPWPLAVGWAGQIAQALGAAHRHGVIHRDIKPANVLLTPEGTVKVLDFGVAKFIGESLGVHELTVTGALLGSPPYMSPEQALGTREIDHRSDLYSLGCLLYHAVTGRPPFIADHPLSVLRMHMDEVPAPPRTLVPNLPEALGTLLTSLLAKRPEDRPQTAAAVHDALSTLLYEHAVATPDLDVTALGYGDDVARRLLRKAWAIRQEAERYGRRVAEESMAAARAEAERTARETVERARREAEAIIAAARTRPAAAGPGGTGTRTRPAAHRPAAEPPPATPVGTSAATPAGVLSGGEFDLVAQGYDRAQVDRSIAGLKREWQNAQAHLDTIERFLAERYPGASRRVADARERADREAQPMTPYETVALGEAAWLGYDRRQVDARVAAILIAWGRTGARLAALNHLAGELALESVTGPPPQ
ncbi:protein kinase [Streptomyces sp. NPDC048291]|uniref:serine/threonine-protein kinase n=1 Tax=Streptomyces sp. NPDC048291 TaxID=3365530 RepID=UPI0037103D53